MSSTYVLTVGVPREVLIPSGQTLPREEFFAWVWREFQDDGLAGVHEGTFLSEQAFEAGHETESWTIDSAQAPRERDWVGSQKLMQSDLYFYSQGAAENARARLATISDLQIGEIREQKAEDWDAQWKASFTGAVVPPFWNVVPPWVEVHRGYAGGGVSGADGESGGANSSAGNSLAAPSEVFLRINPGAGFGTGTHETTQLCLQALGEMAQKRAAPGGGLTQAFVGVSALDFGSGSGILSIGFALLGGVVDAVEIDTLAIDNARENCALNAVEERVTHSEHLHSVAKVYDVLIANILRPVLLEFGAELVNRLKSGVPVVLSGLIESDVESVSKHYSALLGRAPSRVLAKNEWRAVVWT